MAFSVGVCLRVLALTAVFVLGNGADNVTVGSVAGAATDSASCSEVRQVFVMKGIGSSQLVPDVQTKGSVDEIPLELGEEGVHLVLAFVQKEAGFALDGDDDLDTYGAALGEDLELCPSAHTCCSKSMEERYQEAGKKDFRNMLQASGSYLKTLITTSATKFRDTFLDMVQVAENSTNSLFSDVYQSMENMARVPLGQLFADLLAYISGRDVDLEDRVNSFFDSLFPLAYHHSVNSKQKDFTEAYKECLREVQHEVRPFGDLPDKISLHISRSFEAARTFLQALHLGVEVINTTEHMDFGSECHKALVRLTYCPHCQGMLTARPCAGICLNVVRGCLASVSELDTSWSEYVSALERLTSGMVGTYNIEQVLSTVDTKISETIMYVMENTPEITKRVKQKCGHPRRVTRDVPPPPPPSPATEAPSKAPMMRPADTSLYMLLQNFVHKLSESKGFYSNLADNLCNDDSLVIKGELRCWNGQGLGEYTKTIAGVGVSAQKYNPEMKPPRIRDMAVGTLADKLQHVKQILTSRVISVPQSDSSVILEGSGSGARFGSRSDDEDYPDGSGSGDYDKGDKTDLHFDRQPEGDKAPTTSSSSVLRCDCSFVALLLAMFLLLCRHPHHTH